MCFSHTFKKKKPHPYLHPNRADSPEGTRSPGRSSIMLPRSSYAAEPNSAPRSGTSQYDAPSGPPPAYSASSLDSSQASQHDWETAVPDTSMLPPPPSMGYQASSSSNATEDEAMRAKNWCLRNPLTGPSSIPEDALKEIDRGEITLIRPPEFKGQVGTERKGVFRVKADTSSPDSCFISELPLYLVDAHSPFHVSKTKTIYFEVKVKGDPINVGIGFVAKPYPTFRLPGWNRGSLGVHGDDGHRYVNDMWGGRDFTQPFQNGQTLGIGMTLKLRDGDLNFMNQPTLSDLAGARGPYKPINVKVFFTRNGKLDGSWDLHEELDAVEDLPVTGLEGGYDLYAAVGTFEAADFQVTFRKQDWLYLPPSF